ncbi:DnaA regulatory inactivator Hda [Melaminivora jejuensis]|uniref:DnaA regulatory inactivator Hda n=1 Tax=Melaminivora jejuensis TaxID=1267217 RepID=UPI001AE0DAC2|nr:DnaA regulatory inactivator Hda [Melaminivora jejuensis]UHJ64205.1 DnaA regulatory inactivator Hda [Melaminivora jejuensis]
MKQLALDIGLASGPTLENFQPGSNAQALQHLRLAAGEAAALHSPVPIYLWGAPGTGKSHLLRAAYEALRAQGARVGWLDPAMRWPSAFDERWSAVLLHDVHRYSEEQQAAAFNWFINALDPAAGPPRWVLAAGDLPPADLALREDLRSRLAWGHVFQLQPLAEDELRAVLHRQAGERGMALAGDVVDYMLHHFSRDLGSLTGLLDRLDGFALRTQRAVTIPLLKSMLQGD